MVLNIEDITVDKAVVDRYRKNYTLGPEIGPEHVKMHWELERKLTERLLNSIPENRWKEFSECYTTLYERLPWLNSTDERSDTAVDPKITRWQALVRPNARVFEVGSGRGKLLGFLSSIGCKCTATEITRERGSKHLKAGGELVWRVTDGINLAAFEPKGFYDFVISTQVIEHLHPDDLSVHFENALRILKRGGEYIFDTPHRGTGPHDLSRVFGLDRPVCMHLKEYDYTGLTLMLKKAGFRGVRAIFSPPGMKPRLSRLYLIYCSAWDRLLSWLHFPPAVERKIRRRWLRLLLVPSNIWLAAQA